MISNEFQSKLVESLPKMRVWALSLTRNRSAADDLVQDVAMKVLIASESFVQGTNFAGWVHRIMFNHFISNIRRHREVSGIDNLPETSVPAPQQDMTDIREVNLAFQRLPDDQKHALRSIVLEEKSYEEASHEMGCAIGTLKSRVHRARLYLRSEMSVDARIAA
jgi:RNA polymerase sigma-70 factor (ECF subfamily)